VVNYTSALLALDKHADVQVVPRDTLDGIPVGPPIGIPDAPDSLPGKDSLLTGGWATCDQSIVDDSGTGQDTPVILVGQSPRRGHTLAGEALLVHSGGHVYVVYAGYRHEIAAGVDVALELGKESPVTVTGTWLDTVPAGRPIAPIPLSDAGTPSGAVPGLPLVNGQLLDVDDGISVRDKQFYLVTGGALLPVSPLQAAVQRVLGPHADPPVTVTNRALVNATRATPTRPTDDDPPWTRPQFVTVADPETTVCAHFRPGSAVPDVVVGATLPSSVLAAPAGQVRVAVPPGRAALVEVMSGPAEQRGQGTVALVTDQGRLHPLADPRHVPQILGYDGVAPVRVTAVVADRVPRGTPLSPEAARIPMA
jgi:type VII secretion protein EccB